MAFSFQKGNELYTIRIDNLDEFVGDDIEKTLTDDINKKLEEHEIIVGGIFKFPGKQDLFILVDAEMRNERIRAKQNSKDKMLDFDDWIKVNNAINDVLDDHKFYAVVKSSRFIVRIGKRRREDYSGGRTF